MPLTRDIETLLDAYKVQLDQLRARVHTLEVQLSHGQAFLASIRRDQQAELPLHEDLPDAVVVGETETPEPEAQPSRQPIISVRSAVDDILKAGPTSRQEIIRRLGTYPISVKDLGKSASTALARGPYERIGRGLYRMSQSSVNVSAEEREDAQVA